MGRIAALSLTQCDESGIKLYNFVCPLWSPSRENIAIACLAPSCKKTLVRSRQALVTESYTRPGGYTVSMIKVPVFLLEVDES